MPETVEKRGGGGGRRAVFCGRAGRDAARPTVACDL